MNWDKLPTKLREKLIKEFPQDFGVRGIVDSSPRSIRKPSEKPALDAHNGRQQANEFRLVVSIVGFTRKRIDDDNHQAGCKHLRDRVAASIGLGDGDPRIAWQYSVMHTEGEEGELVKVELFK